MVIKVISDDDDDDDDSLRFRIDAYNDYGDKNAAWFCIVS